MRQTLINTTASLPSAPPRVIADLTVELEAGDPVEVRRRFDQRWARGFQIAESTEGGYRLRRNSDGSILPAVFAASDVRPRLVG